MLTRSLEKVVAQNPALSNLLLHTFEKLKEILKMTLQFVSLLWSCISNGHLRLEKKQLALLVLSMILISI
jgi:hypothetical protein